MKKYIKLLRVKHYIKNLLIFVPMFFGGVFFDFSKLTAGMVGFWCFSFISSAIYILNDLKDIESSDSYYEFMYRCIVRAIILFG